MRPQQLSAAQPTEADARSTGSDARVWSDGASDLGILLGQWGGPGSADLDGDGTFDFTYTPSGAEKVAEIYYRFRISPQFDLTPDFQWIANGGANPNADSVKVLGLRANIAY